MENNIIAIVGMCGSGKSVASDILVELGYKKVYFGGVVMEQLKKSNIEVTPENEKMMREKLRKEYGMSAMAQILLPEIKESSKTNNLVLDGLYSWDELSVLKKEFKDKLKTIAIIVDRETRYSRLEKRIIRPFTNEEALYRDITEIENLAKGGPIAFADYYIDNNKDLKAYKDRLLEILNLIEEEKK